MSGVTELFLELAAIPSPPGDEDAVAAVAARYIRDLGVAVEEDDFGNLYARIEPTTDGTPLFLCAHLDTVPPSGELRPVIVTALRLAGVVWSIELTLTSRDMMGFRMLLGREATRAHHVIDPSRSFLTGRPLRKKKKKKTRRKAVRSS